ncbi:putative G-type lectin S-receptor-like serine/threonine-protein kinase LECRK4 [Cocos nucifera]|uniref:Putative G-type lectin S-receptor-like serine/threonine-protein kinase LECRK4 n=1 Tax=Cocos nucifera TaxID=13894 RepID=A0A8K0IFY9_COCNU|nr:putative G-type lectin S-receptor-like serine/threonine-protein kinase LECRK4 [Cocos nucifera]
MAHFSLFHHLLQPLLLLALIIPSYALAYHNISLGSSLTTLGENSSRLSPSGEFAFGFYPLETNSRFFLLAIWFVKTANRTVVWYANGDQPVQDGAVVELTTGGGLSLRDHDGQEVWNAGTSNATYASMLDTGNFVLASADFSVSWQSFANPSDTILPSQVLDLGTELRSRMMDTDYSSGRFKLSVQSDGNLVFYPVAVPSGLEYDSYWASDTVGNGTKLVFGEQGTIYLALNNGTQWNFTSWRMDPMRDFYLRATLDSDGVFRQYVHPKIGIRNGSRNEGWTTVDFQPPDICQAMLTSTGSGACGFNSYCKLDSSTRVDCECPPQYSFLDSNRKYKGCQPNFAAQSCDADEKEIESLYDFSVIIDVDWPLSDYDHYSPVDEDRCKGECLKDCFCAVAIYYQNNGDCWKKKLPLSNGKAGSYVQRRAFIKVPKAQKYNGISLGSSLSTLDDANNSWVSPSGDFAFGFLPLGDDGNLFLLGIWFKKVADKAVVWSANRNRPVPRGSMVDLTGSGRLVLYDEHGRVVWSVNATGVSSAAMLNTGNFVLINKSSSYIWESFNNPTDTILPKQVLGLGTQLYSRLAENDYSQGRFKFSIQKDGNLVFYSLNVPTGYQYEPYWSSNTTGIGTQLIFNSSGYLCLNQMDRSVLPLTQSSGMVSTEDYYHRATLDSDGVLRQYYYPKPNSRASGQPESWSVLWYLPGNICLQVSGSIGSGACGFNSLCKLRDDGRPTCECPPGYSLLDPSNMYMGCKPDGMLTCELTDLRTMMNVDWPTGDYEVLSPVTEHDCGQACLGDCLCAVAIYRNESCSKKKLPLSNGREDPQTDGKALIKRATVGPPGGAKNQHTKKYLLRFAGDIKQNTG